jgi:hypothetical protein
MLETYVNGNLDGVVKRTISSPAFYSFVYFSTIYCTAMGVFNDMWVITGSNVSGCIFRDFMLPKILDNGYAG